MKRVSLRELTRRVKLEGRRKTLQHFQAALLEGELSPNDFSIRDLAEATVFTRNGDLCGREYVRRLNPNDDFNLFESAGAIDSSLFNQLTSQLVFASVMEGYNRPGFVNQQLSTVIKSKHRKEIIPGVTDMVDDNSDEISEGMPYPQTGFGEDYIETPLTKKKGRIISITKEAVFYDQTGMILRNAGKIGEQIQIRNEKDWAKLVLGLVNNYKWRDTSYNTYQTSAPWINVKSSNGITVADGWAKIDAAEQLFNGMTDPNSGEPVEIMPDTLLAMPARKHQVKRILGASEIRDSQATTGTHSATSAANTVDNYNPVFSRWLYSELVASGVGASDAADWWFLGDFKRAIAWIENWPLQILESPTNSEAEFTQDIVLRYKATQKGVFAMMEPRAIVKNYQA